MNPSPISDLAATVKSAMARGMEPAVLKMRDATLQTIFQSDEGRDISSRYAPTANTLAKAVSGKVGFRLRVVLDSECAPDRVYVQA